MSVINIPLYAVSFFLLCLEIGMFLPLLSVEFIHLFIFINVKTKDMKTKIIGIDTNAHIGIETIVFICKLTDKNISMVDINKYDNEILLYTYKQTNTIKMTEITD